MKHLSPLILLPALLCACQNQVDQNIEKSCLQTLQPTRPDVWLPANAILQEYLSVSQSPIGDMSMPTSPSTDPDQQDLIARAQQQPKGMVRLIAKNSSKNTTPLRHNGENASTLMTINSALPTSKEGDNTLWIDLPPEGGKWQVLGSCGKASFTARPHQSSITISSTWQTRQGSGSQQWEVQLNTKQ